ncbi:hypothetical protein R3P38DRAFT_3479795 [Favolaschia claudopus]|uniref:Uncharacterized protein n=1 Tax=Favolaschia claudopus TaxID=2862362 RepID=A0AAV9Z9H3_9AGAR
MHAFLERSAAKKSGKETVRFKDEVDEDQWRRWGIVGLKIHSANCVDEEGDRYRDLRIGLRRKGSLGSPTTRERRTAVWLRGVKTHFWTISKLEEGSPVSLRARHIRLSLTRDSTLDDTDLRKESSGAGIECEVIVVLDVKISNDSSSVLVYLVFLPTPARFLRCNHVDLGSGSRSTLFRPRHLPLIKTRLTTAEFPVHLLLPPPLPGLRLLMLNDTSLVEMIYSRCPPMSFHWRIRLSLLLDEEELSACRLPV